MFKTYNKIYKEPDTHKMKLIKTESVGNKFTSPKAYYDKYTSTLLIKYTHIRICLRSDNTKYELGCHYEYTKRNISITNPSDTKLTELALQAIMEDLGDSGLRGLTYNYYEISSSGLVPNPWVSCFSSSKPEEMAKRLFYDLDLEIKQNLFVHRYPKCMIRLLNEKLPNGRNLFSYGKWNYNKKPIDRSGLIEIVYTPKTKYR